jgi:hypothetical protein
MLVLALDEYKSDDKIEITMRLPKTTHAPLFKAMSLIAE